MADTPIIKGFFRILTSGVLFVLFFCVLHITPSVAHANGDPDASSHNKATAHSVQCIDHSAIRHHEDDATHYTALLPATMPAFIADTMPVFTYEKGIATFSIIGLLPERQIFLRDSNIRI